MTRSSIRFREPLRAALGDVRLVVFVGAGVSMGVPSCLPDFRTLADSIAAFRITGVRPEVPEVFGSFVRVSNSYNGRRALAFTIGFYRKICANGLVAPEGVVQFQFAYTRNQIGDEAGSRSSMRVLMR